MRTTALLLLGAWPVGGIALGLAADRYSGWFAVPLVLLFLTCGIGSMLIGCPRCGWRVTRKKTRIFGLETVLTTPFVPHACSNCGWVLNEPYSPESEPRGS
ncbi:MAG TPA: hypothetical protein VF407_01355 [Polyangiaceae bacterium]